MGEEEVAVFVVGVGREFVAGDLHAALGTYALRTRLLLGDDGAEFEFAKLQVGTHAEERRGAAYEVGVGRHAHVAGLNEFYYFVFLALVAEFEVLRVKVEGGFGVVVEVHVHLVADLSVEAEVDFLIEVETEHLAVAFGKGGVVGVSGVGADFQFGRTLRLYAYAAGPEYFVHGSEVKVHVGEVELVLSLGFEFFSVFLPVVSVERTLKTPAHVFIWLEMEGGFEEVVAEACAVHVESGLLVVDGLGLEVFGVLEVNGFLVLGIHRRLRGHLHGETRSDGVGHCFGQFALQGCFAA